MTGAFRSLEAVQASARAAGGPGPWSGDESPVPWIPSRAARIKDQLGWLAFRLGLSASPAAKRAFDLVLSIASLPLAVPIAILAALAIKLEDGGRILYVQTRVGRNGRLFRCLKFRSMAVDADRRRADLIRASGSGGVRFKMRNDPRITSVGRILRRTSLDELPQIWNVILGDMSLVGPRPPIPEEVARYSTREWRRLDGATGLTCVWQVSGRSCIPFEQQVEMDLAYAQHQSVLLDACLVARTIPAVVSGKGAW